MIGLAESDTERRAAEAVEKALNTPLIDIDIEGASGALINVSGGADMTIKEAQEIVQRVNERLDPEAKIIWGAQIDPSLGDTIRAMIIVTGVRSPQIYGPTKTYTEERKKEIERVLGIDFVD
jgi:cell division protein FtsZ